MLKLSSRLNRILRSSDLDKRSGFRFTGNEIEVGIYTLFRIDLVNFIKIKAALSKQFRIQPSELDAMPYWEYEMYIKALSDAVKDENDQQKAEMKKYHVDDYMNMTKPGNINKMTQSSIPKMNMSMPSMSIPKL